MFRRSSQVPVSCALAWRVTFRALILAALVCLLNGQCAFGHPVTGLDVLVGDSGDDRLELLLLLGFAGAAASGLTGGAGSSNPLPPVTDGLVVLVRADSVNPGDGAPVSGIQNESGTAYALSSTAWPIYQSAGFNGRPGLIFTGAAGGAEFIDVDVTGLSYAGFTVFLALNSTAGAEGTGIVEHRATFLNGSWGLLQCATAWGNCTPNGVLFEVLSVSPIATGVIASQNRILTAVNPAGQPQELYCNGVLTASGGGAPVPQNNGPLFIGHRYNGASGDFVGVLGEIILYNRNLSQAEREEVEAYLFAKYGLSASGC